MRKLDAPVASSHSSNLKMTPGLGTRTSLLALPFLFRSALCV